MQENTPNHGQHNNKRSLQHDGEFRDWTTNNLLKELTQLKVWGKGESGEEDGRKKGMIDKGGGGI